jgi:hypothetical protein
MEKERSISWTREIDRLIHSKLKSMKAKLKLTNTGVLDKRNNRNKINLSQISPKKKILTKKTRFFVKFYHHRNKAKEKSRSKRSVI